VAAEVEVGAMDQGRAILAKASRRQATECRRRGRWRVYHPRKASCSSHRVTLPCSPQTPVLAALAYLLPDLKKQRNPKLYASSTPSR